MNIMADIDSNHDGDLTDKEIEQAGKIAELKTKIEKMETQEKMAWVALYAIIAFTFILFLPLIDISRMQHIGEFIGMFYMVLGGIVAAYMGVQAWIQKS